MWARTFTALWFFCSMVLVPGTGLLAADSELARLHKLTLTELQNEAGGSPDSADVQLAIVRKLGQSDQNGALVVLDHVQAMPLDISQMVYAAAMQCELNIRRGQMETAATFCEASRSYANLDSGSSESRAIALNALGYYYVRQGKAEDALRFFETALKLAGVDDEVVQITLFHNRGVALMLAGLTDLAIEAFEQADKAKSVLAVDESLPTILAYNLGYVQAQAGNHEEALKSYAIVLPWLTETGQLTRAFIAHTQVALSLNGLGRFEEALAELSPWITRAEVSISADSEAQAQLAIGQAYLGLGQMAKAEAVLQSGLDIATASENPSRLRELGLVYATVLLQQNNAHAAINYLTNMLQEQNQSTVMTGLGQVHRLLADAYTKIGDYKKALEHSLASSDALQLAQSDNFARRLASLRVSNELDVKSQQLALAEARERSAETSRQLSGFFQLGVIVSLLVLLILLYLYLSRSANQREADAQRRAAERLQEEVQLRTLEFEEALQQKLAAEQYKSDLEVRFAKDDKLRLIGQLTGGVAHDFNNLMTVIQLSAELLLEDLRGEDKKLVEDILAATSSGHAITSGLLAYARQQVLQPIGIDLRKYLQNNEAIFARSADQAVSLHLECISFGIPLVIKADPGQLTSSILNLILNAREASAAGSRILLTARPYGEKVSIEVRDEGEGMSAQELQTATEPFYTTKGPNEGSGLGLSMVEGFMKQSGGELIIESTPGVGTSVRLIFDRGVIEDKTTEQRGAPAQAEPDESVGILLVEDEPQIRAVCQLVLEKAGYTVFPADNAEVALALFADIKNLKLMISDISMPGMSGVQLAQEVEQEIPDLPILLISGYSQSKPVKYSFLAKPFSTKDFLAKVQELLQKITAPTQTTGAITASV